ncbi:MULTISPECIES: YbaB/EbfC family nucleoid-associated protein [unclassified Arcicella]|uniref:YbaB/EbfC family nucleoid-associated protein n=1 Tax=unclassified Arcicella TaxID=2644986 RepID=UPI002863CDAE|nr:MULTISPECIES: YbaB/EbfC family nucleoid-associated protein [unclassified Arcicella]MDR6563171.1 DNA-binding YbaB/EbfC family protein [Arcicella sp. BE51]MDR6811678.1 DNA-binding YbaB/EbfC family protein [Arcicella sp. BE140]MDR6823203.1 DNA-binding YbaB/EbfC family protein [Arcicella sp. BE139]
MFDMMGMLGKVKDLQAKMKEAQDSLSSIIETGDAGAGMVVATVNGKKQLLKIEIDEDLIKPADREVLQDLIVAATNNALENIEGKIKEHLQKATQGLMPNIPGMDLGSMFGQ